MTPSFRPGGGIAEHKAARLLYPRSAWLLISESLLSHALALTLVKRALCGGLGGPEDEINAARLEVVGPCFAQLPWQQVCFVEKHQ